MQVVSNNKVILASQ